jgi:hypothetical protein
MVIAHDYLEPTETQHNSETKFVDRLLEGWAMWVRRDGIDLRPTPIGFVWRIPGVLLLGQEIVITDDGFVLVDQGIAHLPGRLRSVVRIEYVESDLEVEKWRQLGLNRLAYRQRLHAAQWTLFSFLLPDIDNWRQKFSV